MLGRDPIPASLGRVLWLVAPVALFVAVVLHVAELASLEAVFLAAAPRWLLAAGLLAVAFSVNQGALYQGVFAVLGEEVTLSDAVALALVMAFASLALPAGVASGIAYFVSAARGRGITTSRALLAGLGYYLFDYGALLPVVLVGMILLREAHDLSPVSFAAMGMVALMAVAGAVLLTWGMARPQRLAALVRTGGTWISRRLARRRLSEEAVDRFAAEIQQILTVVRLRPGRSARPLLHAVVVQAIAVGLLDAVFMALGSPVPLRVVLAGYAVGTVFMVISITPSGAGVVEGAMTVTFVSLGVPLHVAAGAAILFRVYTLWLPMLAGFLTLRLRFSHGAPRDTGNHAAAGSPRPLRRSPARPRAGSPGPGG